MKTLTIGILAHVDAGKTSLTERLLFNAGVIETLGSVNKGTTQTDTMGLERQRGITIRAAVTSFTLGDFTINLIDTPGHPDFIAEVERALGVLDAVILVISAVEGIQPQTRKLARVLQKLAIPTLIFVNKIDRMGACGTELAEDIKAKLFADAVIMNRPAQIGTSQANVVAMSKPTQDIDITQLQPIFFGSAVTGVGVPALTNALASFVHMTDEQAPLSAVVFKIERGSRGEKIAYLRIFSGELHVRKAYELHRASQSDETLVSTAKMTALELFTHGKAVTVQAAGAGDIVKAWGLRVAQIADYIGHMPNSIQTASFAPPSLEVVIKPKHASDRPRLYTALEQMNEQDPLIHVHQNEQGVLSVKLYGEVQREVIKTLLHDDYDLEVAFERTQIIYIEKVAGTGTAYASRHDKANFFEATLGIRIEPSANPDISFNPGPGVGSLPVAFLKAVEETVHEILEQGIHGWQITDCVVTLTEVGYDSVLSTGGDFRGLTTKLLSEALRAAGTELYEPINRFELDVPETTLPQVLRGLVNAEAHISITSTKHGFSHIVGTLPVRRLFEFEQAIPDLTGGEGLLNTELSGYQKTILP